jgi:D-xylose 1-dehydrogenase (NADP+, D-xylono-1,5-lactone-forming)
MAETTPVRLGILGTGFITGKLLAGARATDAVDVIAVGSRDATRAEAFASEHGIRHAHGSYEALLADPDVEAVYVSLPNQLHHPVTMEALAAGKHVLCEKPYSAHPEHVTEAFDAAERAGLVLSEAFMWRHSPQTARLLELLPEIGALQVIRASFSFRLTWEKDIRLEPDLDGGSLMDVGCYAVSGARLLAGAEPERVTAESVVGPSGVDVVFTGGLRFPDGLLAQITCGFTTEHMGLEAIGTHGTLRLPDPWHARAGVLYLDDREIRLDAIDPYRLEVENLAAAIRGTAPALLGRDDALGQARTIEALYRAARTTGVVSL